MRWLTAWNWLPQKKRQVPAREPRRLVELRGGYNAALWVSRDGCRREIGAFLRAVLQGVRCTPCLS